MTAAPPSEVPCTAWGVLDLGGVWDYRSVTPLERPEQFADKPVLTEEEAAAFERERAEWVERIDAGTLGGRHARGRDDELRALGRGRQSRGHADRALPARERRGPGAEAHDATAVTRRASPEVAANGS